MADKIHVTASEDYDVIIGSGILKDTGSIVRDVLPKASKILIVSDTNVAPLYMDKVKASIEEAGISTYEYVFEAGERSKNIESVAGMWDLMAKEGFTRTDAVAALGGGVAGDMGGFAAATFLRGIKVIQIPTSLLAMVDSSVGGKTGIDLPVAKNQVGAFLQPAVVIEDTDCLKTLSPDLFTEGMGEVIKYAFIMDLPLYDLLRKIADEGKAEELSADTDNLTSVIKACVADKAYVIANDEFDTGLRQILNFGHTVGHVIEARSDFSLAHGVCVAKGMGIVTDAAVKAGTCDIDEASKMKDLIEAYGLPSSDDISAEDAAEGAMNDKKKRGDTLSLIVVNEIGKASIVKMTSEEYLAFLKKGLAR